MKLRSSVSQPNLRALEVKGIGLGRLVDHKFRKNYNNDIIDLIMITDLRPRPQPAAPSPVDTRP